MTAPDPTAVPVSVRRVSTTTDRERAYEVRRRVFQEEQGVSAEEEFDEDDERALHLVAQAEDTVVGTGRIVFYPSYAKVGRMAVLQPWRRRGVGRALLEEFIRVATAHGASRILLHAQVQAIPFYTTLGFAVISDEFDEAGIPHRKDGARVGRMRTPPAALRQFLEPYDPAIARLFFATRKALLAAAPEATELIYDAYNAVTVAYSFSDRLKEAFCHVAAYRSYVNLGFNRGASLDDSDHLLVGSGTNIRHIRISAVEDLEEPSVQRLIRAAVAQGWNLRPVTPKKAQSIVKAAYATKRRPHSTKH